MNSQQETPTKRRFRYAFDDMGYYMGLTYPINESAIGTPLYIPNSTAQEPFWKDGYIPRWDFHFKNWTLEKRGQKIERQNLEDELTEKIVNKIISQSKFDTNFIVNKISDQILLNNQIDNNNYTSLTQQIEKLTERIERSFVHHFSMFQETVDSIYKRQIEILTILNKPTFYQKLKNWILSFYNKRNP